MHIVHLLPELNQGGVENIVCILNHLSTNTGYSSTVISNGGRLEQTILDNNGRHIKVNLKSKNLFTYFKRVYKLRNIFCNIKPDILHVHSRAPAWITYLANKQLGIPVISTIHGFNHISFYSKIMLKANKVVCVSSSVKQYIISNYNFNNNLHVIHNGVDASYFNDDKLTNKDKMINKYNLHGCFIVSSIGRFTELKDFETFIEGIELANKTNPDIRGIISGYVSIDKRDYYNKIKKLIKDKSLENIIYIILDIPDVRLIYSISNVIVDRKSVV